MRPSIAQAFVSLITLMLLCGAAMAQPGAGRPQIIGKHLVEIGGGRRMNIVCIGQGSPAVVFEYGLGGHMLNWQKVQPDVSALTTACFYDRAGYGFSDPSGRPMTGQNVTDDLYWLLNKAGVQKPIVLVGHSLGGLYATLYADRFPSQVVGLVLIDPVFAGQDLGETPEEQARAHAIYDRSQSYIRNCANQARSHQLSRNKPASCIPPVGRTSAEGEYLAEQYANPYRWEAMLSESQNLHAANALSEDEQEEQRAAISFGDKPVIVLTAGVAPKQPAETEEEHQKNMAHWKAGHDKVAARSSRGESIVVSNALHMIQLDQPQAVIDAIKRVVHEVRADAAQRR